MITPKTRIVGEVTVTVKGAWQRILAASEMLFRGEVMFEIHPENFVDERLPDTTCILTATPEELMAPHPTIIDRETFETS